MKYLAVLLICLTAIAANAQRFASSIESREEFLGLSGLPLTSKYGNIASVKVVVDTRTRRLYFVSSKHFTYHYDFCTRQLFYPYDLFRFNEDNYSAAAKRDYLLANVNFNEASGRYYLDLSVFDLMPREQIVELYRMVAKNTFFGEKLLLLLNTDRLTQLRPELEADIRTVSPTDIYAQIDYQAISTGKTRGRLRFEPRLDSLSAPLLPSDIVVTTATPEFLPIVRGMLLTEMQTPLSHLVILGQNRKIPIGVYARLYGDSSLRKLENVIVELQVLADTFYLKKIDQVEARSPEIPVVRLTRDLSADSLIDVVHLSPKLAPTVGNKAANFGLLHMLSAGRPFKTPEAAFAIPFYWYDRHMRQSGADTLVVQLIANPPADQDSLQARLKAIRRLIRKTHVDKELLQLIGDRLHASGYTTFRFRSSTNAEDAAGFSGAGLYASKTVDLGDCNKTPEEALRKVWESLWSYEAYLERSFFGISNKDVAMGVLVHRSFPAEAANGVAITKNIYRSNYPGFVVNVQEGDVSVVAPPKGVICDQLILYPANELSGFRRTVEIITGSGITDGRPVMTRAELETLQTELERIKHVYWRDHLRNKKGMDYDRFGLDLEFKLDEGSRELYIKQVRIYNY